MRSKMWPVIGGVVLASLLCRVNPASAAEPKKFKPTITANPATVTVENTAGTGKTTLTYDGGKKHPYVEVWVSVNGADLTKVLEDEGDGKGLHPVTVQEGKKYRFVLTDFGKELASVEVRVVTKSTTTTPNTGGGNTTPATKPEDLGKAIVSFAAARDKQKGLGDGDSVRLIEQALAAAGAKPGNGLIWGRELKAGEPMQPGDIIQFTNCVLKKGAATWTLGVPHHTSIVDTAYKTSKNVILWHQNMDGYGPAAKGASQIRKQLLDLALMVSGNYVVYRPEPK